MRRDLRQSKPAVDAGELLTENDLRWRLDLIVNPANLHLDDLIPESRRRFERIRQTPLDAFANYQTIDNQIVTAYQVRAKRNVDLSPQTLEQVRTGMIDVVNGGGGTAHQASLENVEVAGKTGTAQWGPKHKERTAAWFAGFLPADQPRYAFAAVYEGDVGSKVHGGSAAAPMIADVFKDVYKGQMIARQSHQRAQEQPEIRRAEPVEEQDESD